MLKREIAAFCYCGNGVDELFLVDMSFKKSSLPMFWKVE